MSPVIIKVLDDTIRLGYAGKRLSNTQIGYGPEATANFARFTAKFPGKKIYDMPAVGKDSIIGVDRLTPEELW